MDGEVGVDTASLGGAAFWFEAPFERQPAARAERPLSRRTVAIASANRVVAEAARRQIEASGGKALVAAGLDEALAATKPGDVVLVDRALAPDRPPAKRSLLVMLTPEERGHIAEHRAAGFAGYLIKPLRRASLAERVLAVRREDPARAVEDERVAPAAAPGARILLVEDNPINALLARTLLTREGCRVDQAGGGEEALAALTVGAYDLILMDMRMPGLSGLETTQRVRALGVRTPVVALTANAFEEDRHACLAAGMDDFLVKPLTPGALRAALGRWTGVPDWTEKPDHAKVG
jgi:CheY-like chemotaxis protein